MTDSELESLQCYPFHLPFVELRQTASPSYKPLDGHDCEFLGSEEGPCWGQVEDDFILFTGGMTINYYCRGHIRGRAWKYEEEETREDDL